MKTLHAFAFYALFAAVIVSTPARAQQPQQPTDPIPLKVGVIDIEQIRRDSTAVKDARNQIATFHNVVQAEIQKEENELREANQELARQRTILAPEAFNEERRKFEARLVEVQRKVQERRQELDDIQNDVMRRMNESVAEVVVEIAQEQAFTLILRLDQSVFAAQPLLITQIVLDRLNKKLPSIKIAEPASLKGRAGTAKGGASKAGAAKAGAAKSDPAKKSDPTKKSQ
ncbi:MAG: OmpH family outer membrane protein [Pseudomonadota bacterium]|mgnify:CR=1 FL=1